MSTIRKCPHCKSKKGVIIRYQIIGYGEVVQNFYGKELSSERNPIDKLDNWCECIDCGKNIDTELIKQP